MQGMENVKIVNVQKPKEVTTSVISKKMNYKPNVIFYNIIVILVKSCSFVGWNCKN